MVKNKIGRGYGRKISKLNAILLITLLVILLFNLYLNYRIKIFTNTGQTPTGFAASARIKLCIGKPSYVYVDKPQDWAVLSGNETVEATATNPDGIEYIKTVSLAYNELSNYGVICNQSFDGDAKYNCTWDTTAVPDANCVYEVIATAHGPCSYVSNYANYVTVNNHDVPPIWDNFENNLTTNFSKYTSWAEIESPVVGIPNKVALNFSGQKVNFDSADLDSYLTIDKNLLSINVNALPCLMRPAYIQFYNISYVSPIIYRSGARCNPPSCVFESKKDKEVIYSLQFPIGTYHLEEGSYLLLSLSDTTDTNETYVKQDITFYANLTNSVGDVINFSDVYCDISFNTTGNYSSAERMRFNSKDKLYEFNKMFYKPGTFDFKVICNATSHDYDIIENISNFTITNRPPILVNQMPNQTWLENTQVTGIDLDDYFTDPDGDPLHYNNSYVPNINVSINPNNVVTFTPAPWWFGNRTVIFYAYDPYNASNHSNIIYLRVIYVPPPNSSVTSGGGEGESTSSGSAFGYPCVPEWNCSAWGPCLSSGIRLRTCHIINDCYTQGYVKPGEFEKCNYVPTCFDLLKDGNEEGVDCGGPCKPCPSCHNLIKDPLEEGVDCGGPCKPCPSCNNGIKDYNEEGVDCGGPCKPCILEKPRSTLIKKNYLMYSLIGLSLLSMALLFSLFALIILKRKKPTKLPKVIVYTSNLLSKLNDLEKNLLVGKIDKKTAVKELTEEYRQYLKDIFNIHYEFTMEQLTKEVEASDFSSKIKQDVITTFKYLEKIEFSKVKDIEITKLIDKLTSLITELARQALSIEIKSKNYKIVIESKLNLSRKIKNKKQLTKIYAEVREMFNRLSKEEKIKYYDKVMTLYKRINNKDTERNVGAERKERISRGDKDKRGKE